MRHLWPALIGLMIFLPFLCHAENDCPWINTATASGVLGGVVSEFVEKVSPGTTVCKFHSERSNTSYDLQIEVAQMKAVGAEFPNYQARCNTEVTQLHAIGNEAEMCSTNNGNPSNTIALYGEKVIGRVRDRAFIVIVSTSASDDPSMTLDALKEKAGSVAEQVAGALF